MEFAIQVQGPTLAQLTTKAARALRTANRAAGRDIAKLGRKAMNDAAKSQGRRWYGRPLTVKWKVDSSPSDAVVTFNPSKGQSGGWAIAEAGASPHDIYPRRRRTGRAGDNMLRPRNGRQAALFFDGIYAADAFHPGARGVGTWTKATKAIDKVIRPDLEDLFGEALSGG